MLVSFVFAANPFSVDYSNESLGTIQPANNNFSQDTIQPATKNPFNQAMGNDLNGQDTLSAVNKVGNTSFNVIRSLGSLFIPFAGIIATIVLLISSIKSKNRLVNNISVDTVNHVHKKSIILLVLSIICLSVPGIILYLISFVIISKAKKEIDINLGSVKSKVNISAILNIISIVILAISFTMILWVVFVAGSSILNLMNVMNRPLI